MIDSTDGLKEKLDDIYQLLVDAERMLLVYLLGPTVSRKSVPLFLRFPYIFSLFTAMFRKCEENKLFNIYNYKLCIF